jgi:hypothetical protein
MTKLSSRAMLNGHAKKGIGLFVVMFTLVITFGDWTAMLRNLGRVFPSWSVFSGMRRVPVLVVIISILFRAGGSGS